jgi:hypothetical protein
MGNLILTVAPLSNLNRTYRLDTHNKDISKGAIGLTIKFDDIEIDLKHSLKTYINFQNLTNPEINKWILKNGLNKTPDGEPAKIVFTLFVKNNVHSYVFYPYQANLMNLK